MNILQTLLGSAHELRSELHFMPIVAATILVGLVGVFIKYKVVPLWGKNLPPESYGLPFVGTVKQNKTAQWVQERIDKYGPIFKTLGFKMVIATGQSGNRFLVSGTNPCVNFNQPPSEAAILGRNGIYDRLFKL